jgi:hypothetical protein
LARAEGELRLEEELYLALVTAFKSPALLAELTRPGDGDDGGGDGDEGGGKVKAA